jgi:hypothetical protein
MNNESGCDVKAVKFDSFLKVVLTVLLAIIGFFMMQTFATIKSLEKDIITIREKIVKIESTRVSRKDIMEMIADYHINHPCYVIHKKNKEQ